MTSRNQMLQFLPWLGVVLFQVIMTLMITFLVSLVVHQENFQTTSPVLFVTVLGVTFSMGVFLAGWLALKLGWLAAKPKYLSRLVAVLIGAFVPLIVALFLYPSLEAGNPFFSISILASILGFYIPGWINTGSI